MLYKRQTIKINGLTDRNLIDCNSIMDLFGYLLIKNKNVLVTAAIK